MRALHLAFALTLGYAACDSDPERAADVLDVQADTQPGDNAAPDSAEPDTTGASDSAEPDTTAVPDTSIEDTSIVDEVEVAEEVDIADEVADVPDVSPPEPLVFEPFQSASFVIGQADFSAKSENRGAGAAVVAPNALRFPIGSGLIANGRYYLPDGGNARVLIFEPVPSGDTNASDVIGATDLSSKGTVGPNGGDVSSFSRGLCSDGTRFGIANPVGNRVLLYDAPPATDAAPDIVIGQADMTVVAMGTSRSAMHEPYACALAAGRLVVADTKNSRALLWNVVPGTNAPDADVVLGQADFDGGSANRGAAASAGTLNFPEHAWTDGTRLAVADSKNNRVLIWSTWPTVNGQDADLVLGQSTFDGATDHASAEGLSSPGFVGVSAAGQLFIVDPKNNRIVIHNEWPTANGRAADQVLGQSDFTHHAAIDDDQDGTPDSTASARTLNGPSGIVFEADRIWVSDTSSHRIVVFVVP